MTTVTHKTALTKPATGLQKVALITAAPGAEEKLAAALIALQQETLKEPGCITFHFYRSLTSPGAYLLAEEFTSAEALRLHMTLPHTQSFFGLGLVANVSVVDV